ncbi:DUF485 domain-containing protein [Pseudoteredinibacter isoporae]|uniref:Uncharacterized membrane protein (DUF485 family) n=1 Tax=Pseudoteredinibacter isoporae TaxID=570281 RepID=A0A7X0JYM9_9GAMM|nr:DUF485 domain-containing protein [Pseudoteredinibacter isoporae]MBB6523671.1 uncharacterized membrane protein (DUF485 family) [Pseudoteredinibacter isoporae]NHO89175.1 DUF485 domain-containing protein [Pseudoteredinibacter isoporae]NIB22214.1 DUF485 domain-containing protein [Pseudoteredinibacter isoporae]
MSTSRDVQTLIRKKNRLRVVMAIIIMALYFGFALGYGPLKALFAEKMAGSLIPFGLVYFVSLIFSFVIIELIYLKFAKDLDPKDEEVSHYAK